MKPLLLLQYRTDESEQHEQQCITKKLGISPEQLDIRNIIRQQELPPPQQLQMYSGVISGASGHKDSVIEMPQDAQLLAISEQCFIQSYQIKNNIYTTQFHPELDIDDVRLRLTLRPEYCFEKNIEEVIAEYKDISQSRIILKNFREVMEKYAQR